MAAHTAEEEVWEEEVEDQRVKTALFNNTNVEL